MSVGAPTDTVRVVTTRKEAIVVRPQQEVVMDHVYDHFFPRCSVYACRHLSCLGHSFLGFHRLRHVMHSSKGLIGFSNHNPLTGLRTMQRSTILVNRNDSSSNLTFELDFCLMKSQAPSKPLKNDISRQRQVVEPSDGLSLAERLP